MLAVCGQAQRASLPIALRIEKCRILFKRLCMDEEKLPQHWEKVHGAIWLIGLAVLFWTDNIFPGILVLVAISGLVQAGLTAYVKRNRAVETLTAEREMYLPEKCPNCGGPINAATVRWRGKQSASCPYCGSTVRATAQPPEKTTARAGVQARP
jgi:hypothetical protein